jgi:hypothetical protein
MRDSHIERMRLLGVTYLTTRHHSEPLRLLAARYMGSAGAMMAVSPLPRPSRPLRLPADDVR